MRIPTALFLCALSISTPLAPTSLRAESPAARDQRMAWWREARFGMFVHWGLYSGLAGTWNGKAVGTQGGMEWIQERVKVDADAYSKAAYPHFRPVPGFADAWAKLAKEAGCRYLVFTTKHHEGFALHKSQSGSYHAGELLNRDLVGEIVKACREQGLRVGFYHSLIDWHHPDYDYPSAKGLPHPLAGKPSPNGPRDHSRYIRHLHTQVDELLTRYGKVDVMWWDFSSKQFDGDRAWGATDLMARVRERQPEIIVNNRLYGGHVGELTQGQDNATGPSRGDFVTPEQRIPDTGMPGVDWETCMTLNTTWGYSDHDKAWKSAETLVRNLIDVASKGGNYLLNIGPKGDGTLCPETVQAFTAIGTWMKTNAESIHETGASPFTRPDWGRFTVRSLPSGGKRLYLHVFQWPAGGKLVLAGLRGVPERSCLLASQQEIQVSSTPSGLSLALPAQPPDPVATVIALDYPEGF